MVDGAAARLLLMADTHLPKRAKRLPDELWAAVDEADVVVHAGDWVEIALLDRLEERSRRLVGVSGNAGGAERRRGRREGAGAEVAALRLGVVHEPGRSTGREARCDRLYD